MRRCALCKHWRRCVAPVTFTLPTDPPDMQVRMIGKEQEGAWGRCIDVPPNTRVFTREKCGWACPSFQLMPPPKSTWPTASPPIPFSAAAAELAADTWGFNCGPASICAITGLSPEQVRVHMEKCGYPGYTNPTFMRKVLTSLDIIHAERRLNEGERTWPLQGIVRVQWAGPWTKPGVPMKARYKHTHWVAAMCCPLPHIFDVNCLNRWLPLNEWQDKLVPRLLSECAPKASGDWWCTHSIEVKVPAITNRGAP